MLFVFNKDKIISCIVATSIVLLLFIFSMSFVPDSDLRLIQVSTNIINSIENKNVDNNIYNNTINKNLVK